MLRADGRMTAKEEVDDHELVLCKDEVDDHVLFLCFVWLPWYPRWTSSAARAPGARPCHVLIVKRLGFHEDRSVKQAG